MLTGPHHVHPCLQLYPSSNGQMRQVTERFKATGDASCAALQSTTSGRSCSSVGCARARRFLHGAAAHTPVHVRTQMRPCAVGYVSALALQRSRVLAKAAAPFAPYTTGFARDSTYQ